MNKTELAKVVAVKTGIQKGDAEQLVEAVFEIIGDTNASGDPVNIAGFGKFEKRETKARKGRNPQTGEEIEILAGHKPSFKPAKAYREKLTQ
ncbi:HU family DNA-binding protein [Paenibacillus pini]|uniref:DNA-binding protein HBsu n=1 Tax=Paenibacillus pini JCM 16418 TaxID=1236976 RepID=W7Z8Y9_9BACL|nr:HU family DNA-binding protein [Paenibacillus pini]GAF10929.1 DNA-binding protein HBsu [Paenibacillus pini JCM 16418]